MRLEFLPADEINDSTLELCERLITAYHKAIEDFNSDEVGPIWKQLLAENAAPLIVALDSRSPKDLAFLLSTLFTQRFMRGISTADLIFEGGSEGYKSLLFRQIFLLAESLGVIPVSCPEQRKCANDKPKEIEFVVEKIEDTLGIYLNFPQVGAAYGLRVGDRLITMEMPEHAYVASRICHYSWGIRALEIVEIGAGFGGLVWWLWKIDGPSHYYGIIDLPVANVLQGYFLSKSIGREHVSFYGERKRDIRILPTSALEKFSEVDLLISENSMPEMPESAVTRYLSWAKEHADIFYSYNHESRAAAEGIPQTSVRSIVEQVGGFAQLNRNLSWMRPGYVEEVWRTR